MKVLIVRFSSIGDVVLTSPVISALKSQVKDVEIHFLTKTPFASIVEPNPNVDKVITIDKSIDEVISSLKREKYDRVIDLHNNIRTKSLKIKLKVASLTFDKLNIKKWQLVKFKKDYLPKINVVDRYLATIKPLGVELEDKFYPIEYFIESANEVDVQKNYGLTPKKYICIAIGAQFSTKRMPLDLLVEIISNLDTTVVLIGGPTDKGLAEKLVEQLPEKSIIDTTGELNLQQSSSVVKQSSKLLTNDTGMMHIAASFDIPLVTVWGNTVPKFGMYPHRKDEESFSIHEVTGLSCRPCSKIGFQKCPKGHFKCMKNQNVESILKDLK